MRIRDAVAADIPTLVDFVVAEAREAQQLALDPTIATKSVSAAFDDRSLARYWILNDNSPVGSIAVVREWSDWNNAAYWWIQFVYLVPAARGRGLLARLVAHVSQLAAAAKAPELRLYVHHDNARAIRAYEKLGFQALSYRIMSLRPAAVTTADGELDDDALWIAFHERTLPAPNWTHAAHLRMAWMHLARYGLDEAHLHMRVGIIRLNAAHGLVETPTRGYHETLTRVWLTLVAAACKVDRRSDSRTFASVHVHGLERDLPLRYYSRERLFSLEARTTFVSPDLSPLP
jgi:ribosomal protein S18 acetylase RimI-like enzyme